MCAAPFDLLPCKHAAYLFTFTNTKTESNARWICLCFISGILTIIRFLSLPISLLASCRWMSRCGPSTTKEPLFVNGIRFFIWKFIVFEETKRFPLLVVVRRRSYRGTVVFDNMFATINGNELREREHVYLNEISHLWHFRRLPPKYQWMFGMIRFRLCWFGSGSGACDLLVCTT